MVSLHRLNGDLVVVNADHIELLEQTPEVVVVLTTGRRLVVRETLAEVVAAVVDYQRACRVQGVAASLPQKSSRAQGASLGDG